MAHLEGETSNKLFEVLADWNDILKDTSLGASKPAAPANDPRAEKQPASEVKPSRKRRRA
jgi:hypothetical protein